MTVVLINSRDERSEWHNVRMVSSYPDFAVIYFHDDIYPKMEIKNPQCITTIDDSPNTHLVASNL